MTRNAEAYLTLFLKELESVHTDGVLTREIHKSNEPVRVLVRKGANQNSIDHAEYRGVSANAKPQ